MIEQYLPSRPMALVDHAGSSFQDRFALNLAQQLLGQDTIIPYIIKEQSDASMEHQSVDTVVPTTIGNGEENSTSPALSSSSKSSSSPPPAPPPSHYYWRSNITLDDSSALALLYHGRQEEGEMDSNCHDEITGDNPKLLFIDATFTVRRCSLPQPADSEKNDTVVSGTNIVDNKSTTTTTTASNMAVHSQHPRLDCTLGFFFLMSSSSTTRAKAAAAGGGAALVAKDMMGTIFGQYIPCQLKDWEISGSSSELLSSQSDSNNNKKKKYDDDGDQSISNLASVMADALVHIGIQTSTSPLKKNKDGVLSHSSLVATFPNKGDTTVVEVVIHSTNQCNNDDAMQDGDDDKTDIQNRLIRRSLWKLRFCMERSHPPPTTTTNDKRGDSTCSNDRATIFGKQQLRFLYWDLIQNNHLKTYRNPTTTTTATTTTARETSDETLFQNPVDDKMVTASLGCGVTSSMQTISSSERICRSTGIDNEVGVSIGTKQHSSMADSTGGRTITGTTTTSSTTHPIKINNTGKRVPPRGMAPLPSSRRKRNNGRLVYGSSADNADK
jgi:hypothetical protein